MNPVFLNQDVVESLRGLLSASLNSRGKPFARMVGDFLAEPANFIKGPWLSVDLPFRSLADTGEWAQPFPDIPLAFAPYAHQAAAFERLAGEAPRSSLIATGTGSGKTESYLWPILAHCAAQKGTPGIKAILIYPMNALATDQARRLALAISSNPKLAGVSAGIYAGAEPENAATEVTAQSIITSRKQMRQRPPDILLTNYRMLDYLLLRGADRALWAHNQPDTLRFLVVDELHTFDGAQGADLALLIRRLKSRLQTPSGRLICVGSSATLGSGVEAADQLRSYAETIFGEPFDEDAVIREQRKRCDDVFKPSEYFEWPERPELVLQAFVAAQALNQAEAAKRCACLLFPDQEDPDLAPLHTGDPASAEWRILLGELLLESYPCKRVVEIITQHTGPVALIEAAQELGRAKALRRWPDEALAQVLAIMVALISYARSGAPERPRPLFNTRLQLWLRELSRMTVTLPGADPEQLGVSLHHDADLPPEASKRTLPLVNCNRCGSTAHIGRVNPSNASIWASLDVLYEEFFESGQGSHIRLFYHEPLGGAGTVGPPKRGAASGQGGLGQIIAGHLNPLTLNFQAGEAPPDADELQPVWMYNPVQPNGGWIDRTCPACGHDQGLVLFGVRAARLTSSIVSALYRSGHNEDAATAKPRFLMFSDSVQDAAQRGAVAEVRNARQVVQKAMFGAIEDAAPHPLSLHDIIHTLPAKTRAALGNEAFTATFIARDQTWRRPYEALVERGDPITDARLLEHVGIRFGWECFADLTYRSHLSNTLETAGIVSCDVPATRLEESATRFCDALRNAFPVARSLEVAQVRAFMIGVLQRMRQQGAVGHPYLVAAIENADKRGHLGDFAAANQLGIGRFDVLQGLNRRWNIAPIPVSLKSGLGGFTALAQEHSGNWYLQWLLRCFPIDTIGLGADAGVFYEMLMQRLESDGIVRRVQSHRSEQVAGFVIETVELQTAHDLSHLRCNTCDRQETTLALNAAAWEGRPCSRIGCAGVLQATVRNADQTTLRLLRSDRNHRVVAREHTGLLDVDERLRIEESFINNESTWAPNLISATPTLEMGIDIGDLSTLLLCSVPPEEANYVQRMGRSGRRDGNALNLVIANGKPHDLQFWDDPEAMIAGQIKPPGVYIEAEAVLLRQIAAFTLDQYVVTHAIDDDYGQMKDLLRARRNGDTGGFPADWLAFVAEAPIALADQFIDLLPKKVQNRGTLSERLRHFLAGNDARSLSWRVAQILEQAEAERSRLLEKRDELNKALKELKRIKVELEETTFEQRKRELERHRTEINRLIRDGIDNVRTLAYLTDKGLLPNYAFPEEGIKLTSFLARRDATNLEPDERIRSFEYQRSASAAMSEFALGQKFYAKGREVTIKRLELTAEDITQWRFCPSCELAMERSLVSEESSCPNCHDPMWADQGSDHHVVLLKSVIASEAEEKAVIRDNDQRQQRQYDRAMFPAFEDFQVVSAWWTGGEPGASPFGFELIENCEFRDFNFGPRTGFPKGPKIAGSKRLSAPFRICRYCGTAQSDRLAADQSGDHVPACTVLSQGLEDQLQWLIEIFLMREFSTEAVRILIPVTGDTDHDDIKSFVAGINLGMRRYFAGKVDHIQSTVVERQLDNHTTLRSLFLYDAVPGGSGYLRQLAENPESMRQVVTHGIEALQSCVCQQTEKTGCFRCVKPYRSQFGPGEPDRDRALDLLLTTQKRWETLKATRTGLDRQIQTARLDSELEKRFIGTLRRFYGEQHLQSRVLDNGRIGFVLEVGEDPIRRWNIETQVEIHKRFTDMPEKRVDFLLTPIGAGGPRPIVVEMDGFEHHANTVQQDVEDRFRMIRSGHVWVWTLTWDDLKDDSAPLDINLLRRLETDPNLAGIITKINARQGVAGPADIDVLSAISRVQPLELFRTQLEQPAEIAKALRLALRAVLGKGQPLDAMPRIEMVDEMSRAFLSDLNGHAHWGDGDLDLYIAGQMHTDVAPIADWLSDNYGLRVLLRPADWPEIRDTDQPAPALKQRLRKLWHLTNLLQQLPLLHIALAGLDTLIPPESSAESADDQAAWEEAHALVLPEYHLLLDAMRAAGIPPPHHYGTDLRTAERVEFMVEMLWETPAVGISDTDRVHPEYHILGFNPGTCTPLEFITRLQQAFA